MTADSRKTCSETAMSVALFGTSADPPTTGHKVILQWLSRSFDAVATWATDNPFKTHQAPLEHREAMLRLLIGEVEPQPENVRLYPELSSPHTLTTVEHAQHRWPRAKLTLVVGSDLISQLPQWYRAEDLLSQVRLLVVPRTGYPLEQQSLQQLQQMGAQLDIADLRGPGVSSTDYRDRGDLDALTSPIQDYIDREQLYVTCQDVARSR